MTGSTENGREPLRPISDEKIVAAALSASQVLEGFDASGQPKLRAAKRPITLKHLLTHTAGFTYGFFGSGPVDGLSDIVFSRAPGR